MELWVDYKLILGIIYNIQIIICHICLLACIVNKFITIVFYSSIQNIT